MDDIAHEAGATKPRLYRQFEDKADIFRAIAQRTADDVYKLVLPDFNFVLHPPRQALRHAIGGYAEVIAQHPNVFRFLARGQFRTDDRSSAPPLDVGRDIATRFARVASTVLDSISVDTAGVEFASRAAVGAIVSATDLWLGSADSPDTLDATDFADQIANLVWGLIDAFLRRKGIEVDPDEPIFMALAKMKGTS